MSRAIATARLAEVGDTTHVWYLATTNDEEVGYLSAAPHDTGRICTGAREALTLAGFEVGPVLLRGDEIVAYGPDDETTSGPAQPEDTAADDSGVGGTGAGGDQAARPHPLAELLVALGILIGKGLPAPWSINGTSLAWPEYAATMQLFDVSDVDAWATHHGAPATDQGEPYIANQSKPWIQYGATCMVAGQAVNVWTRRNLEPDELGGQS